MYEFAFFYCNSKDVLRVYWLDKNMIRFVFNKTFRSCYPAQIVRYLFIVSILHDTQNTGQFLYDERFTIFKTEKNNLLQQHFTSLLQWNQSSTGFHHPGTLRVTVQSHGKSSVVGGRNRRCRQWLSGMSREVVIEGLKWLCIAQPSRVVTGIKE
jgi:hypothetical protein